jgi:hypothetical protein
MQVHDPQRWSDYLSDPELSPPRILLAEDDAEMRALVSGDLRRAGYGVVECADGSALLVALTGFLVPMPLMALDVLIGLLQAYIFAILATVYVGAAIRAGETAGAPEAEAKTVAPGTCESHVAPSDDASDARRS